MDFNEMSTFEIDLSCWRPLCTVFSVYGKNGENKNVAKLNFHLSKLDQ